MAYYPDDGSISFKVIVIGDPAKVNERIADLAGELMHNNWHLTTFGLPIAERKRPGIRFGIEVYGPAEHHEDSGRVVLEWIDRTPQVAVLNECSSTASTSTDRA